MLHALLLMKEYKTIFKPKYLKGHQPTHLSRRDFRRDKYNGWTRLASKVLQLKNVTVNEIYHD